MEQRERVDCWGSDKMLSDAERVGEGEDIYELWLCLSTLIGAFKDVHPMLDQRSTNALFEGLSLSNKTAKAFEQSVNQGERNGVLVVHLTEVRDYELNIGAMERTGIAPDCASTLVGFDPMINPLVRILGPYSKGENFRYVLALKGARPQEIDLVYFQFSVPEPEPPSASIANFLWSLIELRPTFPDRIAKVSYVRKMICLVRAGIIEEKGDMENVD